MHYHAFASQDYVKRFGEPSEIASIISWLAGEESGYSTGAEFSVNGGLHMN